ncbi:MAG TPA: hypothetical protein VGR26_16700 [Acidimicrobiales bacterium]|nr:hypothetical protein [Acidimicrobiales bacterium]
MTQEPSRANAWLISDPMGPPPRTASRGGQLVEVEQVLVGQRMDFAQTLDGGYQGRRAGGDDEPRRADPPPADIDLPGRAEHGPAVQHLDPLRAEDVVVLGRSDGLDGPVQLGGRLLERLAAGGGGQQRLGWHAPGEGAVASEATLLDEQHRRVPTGGLERRTEPAGAAADDDDVVGGLVPYCRVHESLPA